MIRGQIWYMQDLSFNANAVKATDEKELAETHTMVAVGEYDIDLCDPITESEYQTICEYLWRKYQGEVWSPNGEAAPLVEALGLSHTSMSVGDVIVLPHVDFTTAWVVDNLCFRKLW
jgi:hypothetical protein